jgi:hypothetical protein
MHAIPTSNVRAAVDRGRKEHAMSDERLISITRIMTSVNYAIASAQRAAREPTSSPSRATWEQIVARLCELLCEGCSCGCGDADCVPCLIENALNKARDHVQVLAAGSAAETGYHTRLVVENLQSALTLARDELQRAALCAR